MTEVPWELHSTLLWTLWLRHECGLWCMFQLLHTTLIQHRKETKTGCVLLLCLPVKNYQSLVIFSHNEYLSLLVLETDMLRIKTQKNPLSRSNTISESAIVFPFLYIRKHKKEKKTSHGVCFIKDVLILDVVTSQKSYL